MTSCIEVKVGGRGVVRGGDKTEDPGTVALCALCGKEADAVVSTAPGGGPPFACKACLRGRLEAITVGLWLLKEPADGGLPWGKISG